MNKLIAIGLMVASAINLWAQAPEIFRYQGRLVDGTNLVNATLPMSFKLYDALSGGTKLYEDSNSVLVVDGLYSTTIGDNTVYGSLIDALTNSAVYLELTVNGETLSPREQLVSVPYALNYKNSTLNITQEALDARYVLLTGSNITSLAAFRDSIGAAYTGNTVRTDGSNITNASSFRAAIGITPSYGDAKSLALIGDSLTQQSGQNYNQSSGGSYSMWAVAFSRTDYTIMTNKSVGGYTTSQILTLLPTVLASGAKTVIFCGGVNDGPSGVSVGQTITNIESLVSQVVSNGQNLVIITIPPKTDDTTNNMNQRVLANRFIMGLPKRYNRVAVADLSPVMVNPETGKIISSNIVFDTVHWNDQGASLVGMKVAEALKSLSPATSDFIWSPDGTTNQAIANASFKSSGIGWTLDFSSSNGTFTVISATATNLRNVAVITATNLTSGPASIYCSEYRNGGRFGTGDRVQMIADVEFNYTEFNGTNHVGPYLDMYLVSTNHTTESQGSANWQSAMYNRNLMGYIPSGRVVLKTNIATVSDSTLYLDVHVGLAGVKSGTLKIHNLSVSKVVE